MDKCWHIRTSDRPTCRGYKEAGYTCVGDQCAAMDPQGDPHLCARLAPRGFVLDALSGTCVMPKQTDVEHDDEHEDDDLEWERWLEKERARGSIPRQNSASDQDQ